MAFLRSLLFALDLLPGDRALRAAVLPGEPVRQPGAARCRPCLGALPPLVRAPHPRHPHPRGGRAAARRGAGRGQAPVDVRDDGDGAAARRAGAGAEARACRTSRSGAGWRAATASSRSTATAARRRCAAMMRAAEAAIAEGRPIVLFPEGTRVARRRAAAAAVGLRRPLPRAEAAGRAGGARQRPALAARTLRQAAGHRHLPLRRADPARPEREEIEGRGPRRDQRAGIVTSDAVSSALSAARPASPRRRRSARRSPSAPPR